MSSEKPHVEWIIRVKPGRAGANPNAPDWEVVELRDGVIETDADVFDNLTLAEAENMAGMWTRKKDEAEAAGEA